jgi:putative FmdB family regulatory protein
VPIYEYKCEGCGETFEVIQKFSDEPLTVHDKCGGHVHRLLSAPAFQFKGSGWYVTDYAKGNSAGAAKHEGKSESADKSSGETAAKTENKGESKTETKSESKPAGSEKAS